MVLYSVKIADSLREIFNDAYSIFLLKVPIISHTKCFFRLPQVGFYTLCHSVSMVGPFKLVIHYGIVLQSHFG